MLRPHQRQRKGFFKLCSSACSYKLGCAVKIRTRSCNTFSRSVELCRAAGCKQVSCEATADDDLATKLASRPEQTEMKPATGSAGVWSTWVLGFTSMLTSSNNFSYGSGLLSPCMCISPPFSSSLQSSREEEKRQGLVAKPAGRDPAAAWSSLQ